MIAQNTSGASSELHHQRVADLSSESWIARFLPVIAFAAAVLIGILVFQNYGLAWDEHYQYYDNGLVNVNYIRTRDPEPLLRGNEKYHGPAYEIVLVVLAEVLRLQDTHAIFRMRHLVNYLLFLAGVSTLYGLVRRLYANTWVALTGGAMLFLSPRFLGHAFFNTKDIPFMVFYLIAVATLASFHQSKSWKSMMRHALASGFLIAIRIPGAAIPFLTLLLGVIDVFRAWKTERQIPARLFILYAGYVALTFGITVLCWPVLWEGPVSHLIAAFQEMKQYTHVRDALYFGRYYAVDQLPWHYVPVWIVLSTPPGYVALMLAGILAVATDIVRWRHRFFAQVSPEWIVWLCLGFPVIAIILFRSTVYDDWRHVYFLYPLLLVLASRGLVALLGLVNRLKQPIWTKLVRTMVALIPLSGMGEAAWHIIRTHPYEYVYFSPLAGNDMAWIKRNFELDYWGLTFTRGLEAVLQRETGGVVRVAVSNKAGFFASEILSPQDRSRLRYVRRPDEADFFLTNYRWHPEDYPYTNIVFSIRRGNADLLTVFDMRH